MGKIGDLIVRLQLKYEDYKKGLKQAEKDTQGFAGTLGKIKGVGLAVWGAIGGAVLKVASDMVKSTNQMEDVWAQFTTKAKAGWQTFIRTLTNGDWSNFITNFKAEVAAASHLQDALDADTEILNSINIQKAKMADQLATLEVAMRDQTKSYKERAQAAQKYLNLVTPIYDKEIERAKKLKSAQYKAFLGNLWPDEAYSNPVNLKIWDQMLIDYGSLEPIINGKTFAEIIERSLNPSKFQTSNSQIENRNIFHEIISEMEQLAEWGRKRYNLGAETDVRDLFHTFFRQYEENRNGEDVKALVDSILGLEKALSARNEETKKVQSALNSASAQLGKEATAETEAAERLDLSIEKLSGIKGQATVSSELPDIIPDDWLERNREKIDEALAEAQRLQNITNEINDQFNNAVASSLSGATQALVECIAGVEGADASQVLTALLQPFASTMTSLGEMLLAEGVAIEAFKTSLESLNGAVAIAAGLGLIALGSALSAGIRSLASKSSGSATTTSSYSGGSSADMQNIQTEMTVYVKGTLKGSDIVLSGQKTVNNWAR